MTNKNLALFLAIPALVSFFSGMFDIDASENYYIFLGFIMMISIAMAAYRLNKLPDQVK